MKVPQKEALFRHPEVIGALRRASKGDGLGLWPSFEARALRGRLRMTPEFEAIP